ncbi:50S ribosomal protein L35 [bacterium (Candidatus Moisslbacteria) CG02_land_8_20_14_3_00_36_53]|nr:MAG: 50S ribosomal protein L35 [bacterium (Candidatus Moisslbacteria) CG02_land_8_20_14_3_00_36_53]
MSVTSIAKRFKITKRKKFLHKRCGQDHFRAKKSGEKIKNLRKDKEVSSFKKVLKSSL